MTINEMLDSALDRSEFYNDFKYRLSNISYICDCMYEIAEERACDTSWREIDDILVNYTEEVEEVINEYGWNGVDNSLSVAATRVLENHYYIEMQDYFQDDIFIAAIEWLEENYEHTDYPDALYKELKTFCYSLSTGDCISDVIDMIKEWVEENMADEEFSCETELENILDVEHNSGKEDTR